MQFIASILDLVQSADVSYINKVSLKKYQFGQMLELTVNVYTQDQRANIFFGSVCAFSHIPCVSCLYYEYLRVKCFTFVSVKAN